MYVPEIGGRTIFKGLGDDLTQALGRKGVIRQTGQRQPFKADLPTIAFPPLPNRGKVLTETMEDRLDLMKVAMDSMHGVVLADVFAKVQETLRHDLQAKFFQDFSAHSVAQRLAVILSATGENKELSFFGTNADREDVFTPQNDRSGGRPDPRGSTTRLATRSGHEATLPRQAGQ
jgi:hypothetical protein